MEIQGIKYSVRNDVILIIVTIIKYHHYIIDNDYDYRGKIITTTSHDYGQFSN